MSSGIISDDTYTRMIPGTLKHFILQYVTLKYNMLFRFTPYEWHQTHTPDGEKMENIFSLANCLWFAIGSLMQQSCDFLPK